MASIALEGSPGSPTREAVAGHAARHPQIDGSGHGGGWGDPGRPGLAAGIDPCHRTQGGPGRRPHTCRAEVAVAILPIGLDLRPRGSGQDGCQGGAAGRGEGMKMHDHEAKESIAICQILSITHQISLNY
jgi:hypothetical protein